MDAPSSSTPGPGDGPGFLLWQVANAWQRRLRQALEKVGLTHVQFVLLAGIKGLEEAQMPITQATLARFVRVDEMMTSQVIRMLERRGTVMRRPHPHDLRARSLALSEEGERLLEWAKPIVAAVDEAFFSLPEEMLNALVQSLWQLIQSQDEDPDQTGTRVPTTV